MSDPAKKLAALLRRLHAAADETTAPPAAPETPDESDSIVHELVFSFLLWEMSTSQARAAFKRLGETYVDYNDLRVSLREEINTVLGDRDPVGPDRAMRLKATLNDLYRREHGLAMSHLMEGPKRDIRTYLESLDGIPQFVASRVYILCFGGHAMPVDSRLTALLLDEGALEPGSSPEAAASWLERHVRAPEASPTHRLLQAWSDEEGHSPRRDGSTKKKAPVAEGAGGRKQGESRAGKSKSRHV